MSEMASTLPNTGGVVSWFTGNNDMDKFGEQLIPFGEAIKAFGDTVADLKSEDIEAAATAGKIMSEMASTLPNSGGVVSWFTGNNDMDKFGKQLENFGNGIKSIQILFPESISVRCQAPLLKSIDWLKPQRICQNLTQAV